MIPELRTRRLLLRGWREPDRAPFAQMNADPVVMRYFPSILTRAESDAAFDRYQQEWTNTGFSKWAIEIPGVAPFAGCLGLARVRFEAWFTPCVEIGWRLHPSFWRHGYATEAARAALDFGFQTLGLSEIVAFTVPENRASVRVMEKLGMEFAGEFDHPGLAAGHRLKPHLLYRIDAKGYTSDHAC